MAAQVHPTVYAGRVEDDPAAVREIIGVYDADGSLIGELRYLVGARLGHRHCSLCDITHGTLREKASWRASRARLPVPVRMVHRDERDDEVRRATTDTPAVVARTDDGIVPLLGPADLEVCAADPDALVAAVIAAAHAHGLALVATAPPVGSAAPSAPSTATTPPG